MFFFFYVGDERQLFFFKGLSSFTEDVGRPHWSSYSITGIITFTFHIYSDYELFVVYSILFKAIDTGKK